MSQRHQKVGDIIRGDHQILSVHKGFLGVVYICRQELPNGKFIHKAIKTFRNVDAKEAHREFVNTWAIPPTIHVGLAGTQVSPVKHLPVSSRIVNGYIPISRPVDLDVYKFKMFAEDCFVACGHGVLRRTINL